jgi:hypothetical protein
MVYTVDIYLDRNKLEYERINKPIFLDERYQYILDSDEIIGQTLSEKRLIQLYLFKLNSMDENKRKIEIVANLFHEVRHAWQNKNKLYTNEAQTEDIGKDYFILPSERDAYLFQAEMMNRYNYSISKIMEMPAGFMNFSLKPEILAKMQ